VFTEKELEATKRVIKAKKEKLLNSEEGSDADYIRNLQTLIKLENAADEKEGI